MRRAQVSASRARACAARYRAKSLGRFALATAFLLPTAFGISGCGGQKASEQETLGFEFDSAPDSAKLVKGRPLLSDFEPYRASNGMLRVRGRFALPDGAKLQISVRRRADGREVGREQVRIVAGGFDTPPFPSMGEKLPEDDYAFEISTQFNRVWQPENVLAATRSGLSLSGPGMRRGAQGEAIYRLTIEEHL